MVWVCGACRHENHKNCENRLRCDCECNVNGAADVTQKALASVGGVGLVIGGLALTILSGGWLIPIGGAMMGAGISSTYQGVEKSIKKERISGVDFCADVAFDAATGVLTGGIGAAGETVAAKVVQQGAKEVVKAGAKKLAIRTAAGAVAGVASKVVDETKECLTTDKKWSQFGQTLDENGEVSGTGTFVSWATSTVVGGLGGVGGHISSSASQQVTSSLTQSTIRVGVSGATAAVGDATIQTINIATGKQKEFDVKRAVKSAAVSSITAAAFEGAQGGIYKLNGGKDQVLLDKANEQMIKDKVPTNEQSEVLDSYNDLKKLSPSAVSSEMEKPAVRNDLLSKRSRNQAEINEVKTKIKQTSEFLKTASRDNQVDISTLEVQQNQLEQLKVQEKQLYIEQKRIDTDLEKQKQSFLNDRNAHVLIRDRSQQIASDIGPPSADKRGAKRAVFDYDVNPDKNRLDYSFAGYTDDHQYQRIPDHGLSDYSNYHQRQVDHLEQIQQGNNLMVQELCNKDEDEER